MKRTLAIPALLLLLLAALPAPVTASPWAGVDETVIEKVAEAAGRPPRDPFINTDQGDLLLFVFLLAGIAGGFIAGYHFRTLFPPRGKGQNRAEGEVPRRPGSNCGISAATGNQTPLGTAPRR